MKNIKSTMNFDEQYEQLLHVIKATPELRNNQRLKKLAETVYQSHLLVEESRKRSHDALADISCDIQYIQFEYEARLREKSL